MRKSGGTSIKTRSKISKAGSVLDGKHTTLAQVAVMRKMIIIAHSLYKNNTKYDKEVYSQS